MMKLISLDATSGTVKLPQNPEILNQPLLFSSIEFENWRGGVVKYTELRRLPKRLLYPLDINTAKLKITF